MCGFQVFHNLSEIPQDGVESVEKKQHKHRLFGPDFTRTFLTLTPGCPGAKKFLSPPPGPQKNALFGADVHDFQRGRP